MSAQAVLVWHCDQCARERSNGHWEIRVSGERIAVVDWVNDAEPGELPRLNERKTEIIAKSLALGWRD